MLHLTDLDFPLPNYVPGDAAEMDAQDEETLLERGCKLVNVQVVWSRPDYPHVILPPHFRQILDDVEALPRTLRYVKHWGTLDARVWDVFIDAGKAEASIGVPPQVFEVKGPAPVGRFMPRQASGKRWWQ